MISRRLYTPDDQPMIIHTSIFSATQILLCENNIYHQLLLLLKYSIPPCLLHVWCSHYCPPIMSSHRRKVTNPLLHPTLDIDLECEPTSDTDSDLPSAVADSEYTIGSQTEEVEINHIIFAKEETLNRSRKRNCRVYRYGTVVIDKSTKKAFYWCKPCCDSNVSKLYATSSTNHIATHLEKSHNIVKPNTYDLHCKLLIVTLPHNETSMIPKVVADEFRARLVTWMTVNHISYS